MGGVAYWTPLRQPTPGPRPQASVQGSALLATSTNPLECRRPSIRNMSGPAGPPPSYEEATGQRVLVRVYVKVRRPEWHDLSSAAIYGPVQWPNARTEIRHHADMIPAGYESDDSGEEDICRQQ